MPVNVARKRYREQRCNAKLRGIPWQLTYVQWRLIWARSGHWHERGRNRGQYVMARYNDSGPYSVNTVKIIQSGQNVREVWADPERRATLVRKMSESRIGKPRSAKFKASIAAYMKGKRIALGCKRSLKTRLKISENNARAMLGRKHSDETKRKMSLAHRRRLGYIIT